MVVCYAVINFDDGSCCIYNVFKDTNMGLGYIAGIFFDKKEHQPMVTMNIISSNESKARLKNWEQLEKYILMKTAKTRGRYNLHTHIYNRFIVYFHMYNPRKYYLTVSKLSNESREWIRVSCQSRKQKERLIFFTKIFISFWKFYYTKNTTEFMIDYSENVSLLNDYYFVFRRSAFSENQE